MVMFRNAKDADFDFLSAGRKINIPKGPAVIDTPGILGDLLIDGEIVYFYGPNGWTPIGGGTAIHNIGAVEFGLVASGTNTQEDGDTIGSILVAPSPTTYNFGPDVVTAASSDVAYGYVLSITTNGPEFTPPSFSVSFDPSSLRIAAAGEVADTVGEPYCSIYVESIETPNVWAKANFSGFGNFNENTLPIDKLVLTNFTTSGEFNLVNGDTEIQWGEVAPYPSFRIGFNARVDWG